MAKKKNIKAQAGDTLFVSNPNDPRLKAYQDSLNLYKAMQMQDKLMGPNYNDDNTQKYNAPKLSYFTTKQLKENRKKTTIPNLEHLGPISVDFQNQKEMFFDTDVVGNNDKKLVNYYKSLGFTDDNIMYHDSSDVVHPKIRPIDTYHDGTAWSPVYKKPTQSVVYQPVKSFNKKTPLADLTNMGQINSPAYHAQNIQQTPSDFSFTIRDEKEAGKQRTINFPDLATWQSFRDNNVTPISSEISGDNKRAQGAGYLKEYFTGGALPGAGSMMYARTGQDWKPKNISQAGKMIAAQAGLTAYDYSNPRKFQNVVSESTATKQRPATLGYNKQEQVAEQNMLAQKIVNENARKQARIQERQAASRTREDKNAPFTFEDGQKKLWQDMNWRERLYVAGKNLGNQSRIFKDEENIIDDIQPLGMLGNMMEAVGTAPKQAQESDSVMPYVGAAAGPLATGAMGTIGAKNMGQWASNVMGTDVFKDLKNGVLGIKDAIDDKIIIPLKYRDEIQELKNLNNEIPEIFSRPDVVEKLNVLGIDKNAAQEVPFLMFRRDRKNGSHYFSPANAINIDFRQLERLRKDGYELPANTVYHHELGHKLQRDFDKTNPSFQSAYNFYLSRPTGIDRTTKDWLPKKTLDDRAMDNAHYFFENPVEPLAHLREMRQNMINSKVIKDQFEPITEQHLETFGNLNTKDRVASFMDLNNPNVRRKMKDIFRMLPAVAPAVAAIDQKQAGGFVKKAQSGDTLASSRELGEIITPEHYYEPLKTVFPDFTPYVGEKRKQGCPDGIGCVEQAVDRGAELLRIDRKRLIPDNAAYRTNTALNYGMVPVWNPSGRKNVNDNYVPFPKENYKDLLVGDQVGLTRGEPTFGYGYGPSAGMTEKDANGVTSWAVVEGFTPSGTPILRHGFAAGHRKNYGQYLVDSLKSDGTHPSLGMGEYRVANVFRARGVQDGKIDKVKSVMQSAKDVAKSKANTSSSAKFYLKNNEQSDINQYPVAAEFSGYNTRQKTKDQLINWFEDKNLDKELKYKLNLTQQELDNLKPVVFGLAGQESNLNDIDNPYNSAKELYANSLSSSASKGLFQIKFDSLTEKERKVLGINKPNDLLDDKKSYQAAILLMKNAKKRMDAEVEQGTHPELKSKDPYFRAAYYYNSPARSISSAEEWGSKKDPVTLNPNTWMNPLVTREKTTDYPYVPNFVDKIMSFGANSKNPEYKNKAELRMDKGSYPYKLMQAAADLGITYDFENPEKADTLEEVTVVAPKNKNSKFKPASKQGGGTLSNNKQYIDSVLSANKNLNWVSRLYEQNPKSIMVEGQKYPSTHLLESGDGRVYPTVVQMPDGTLKHLGKDAYNYADSTKTFIQFPSDKEAQWFGKNYKKGTNVLKGFETGGNIPVSSNGLYEYPNQDVIVPTPDGSITMEGIDTNVMATDLETGQQVEMEPGQNYQFEGNMVLEQPLGGGDKPSKAAQMQRDSKAVLSAKSMFDKNKTYQQILKEVSEEMKVDPRFLFGSAYQEGLDRVAVNPDFVSKGYERSYLKDKKMKAYPVDGFILGLDNFGSRYKEFVKKGYLPADFDFYPFKATNEKGPVTTAAFRNTKDAFKAKAAFMKAEADSVKEYAGKLKIELSPEDEAYFAMASYNGGFGNAKKMMDNLKKSGLKAKDWIEKGNTGYKPIHDHVYPRLNRALLATEFFEAGGSIQNKGQLKKLDQLVNFTNYNYE